MNRSGIIRLSKYKSSLNRLKALGFVKVFSDNLADAVGVTPAQVRKDFSLFGITGNKKGGYQIDELLEKLNTLLGKNEILKTIIVGAGNMGTALMNYKGFEKEGIRIIAAFDSNPAKQKREGSVPVLPMEEMAEFVKKNDIHIGIIAVNDVSAQMVLDSMVQAGIRGVLNFASLRLIAPETVVIHHVNLVMELETLSYFVNAIEKSGPLLLSEEHE